MPTTMATAIRTCRILYYGPAGCGKRENLAKIQASLPAEHRLAVATTDPSRQIAFMLRNGNQGDWQVFVQALDSGHEPPVASGADAPFDGIVFVCDSRVDGLDESLSAMEGLKTYLDCWRLDIMAMPVVLQYNRRDNVGVLPVDRLESLLNPWGLLSFPSATSTGEGVRETLKAILSLTISSILQRQVPAPTPSQPALDIDPNPPVPGTPHTPAEPPRLEAKRQAPVPKPAAEETARTLVIPMKVPRSMLEPDGTGRIMLEIQIYRD
ncbi:MAG: hypothetical protein RBT60_02490 [Candidatus Krumholzibacteria bacterium]|nr:hypothetical protein [Candidatus Krumholzibacteria bacterium]